VALDPFELSADGRAPGADECAGETHQKQADSFLAGVVDKEGDHLIGSAHRRRGWQESADHPEAEKEHHHQQRSCPDQQPLTHHARPRRGEFGDIHALAPKAASELGVTSITRSTLRRSAHLWQEFDA